MALLIFLFTIVGSLWLLPEERYLLGSFPFWAGSTICVAGVSALFWGSLGIAASCLRIACKVRKNPRSSTPAILIWNRTAVQ